MEKFFSLIYVAMVEVDHICEIKFRRNLVLAIMLTTYFSVLMVASCNYKKVAGVTKDFDTGLTASYINMQPKSAYLVMNNEVLNHTDIPIGESFQLVNDGVEGMVQKNGKVSAGCYLKMSDDSGKILMEVADLFEGKDLFDKDSASMLRCTISTGEPMEWEKIYKVQAIFWDKYGSGKITNDFSIRAIDIP
jgi:hypothetical protein